MSRWTKHFDALTQSIAGFSSAEKISASAESTSEAAVETVVETVVETTRAAATIEQALIQGMQVSLGDLQASEHGWQYRGQPVMVFAVDVNGVEDANLRRDFYHRIHLSACCSALESPEQIVWIGTAREALKATDLQQALTPCEYCLTKANHRGYRSLSPRDRERTAATFSFLWHVSQYSSEYFADGGPVFWAPGIPVQELAEQLQVSADSETSLCNYCHWSVPAQRGWLFTADSTQPLGIDVDCCVLCAQQQATGVLTLPADTAIAASEARFRAAQLAPQPMSELTGLAKGAEGVEPSAGSENQTQALDWSQVRKHLPVAWYPLVSQLERQLSPPQLYYRFAGYEGVAILAWPEHRRGIIADGQDKSRLPESWDFWTLAGVVNNLN